METTPINNLALIDLWRILRKKWFLLVLISLLLAIGVGIVHACLYTPIYSSSSQYYVSNVSDETPLYSNGQTSGAMEMATYCAQFLDGSVVLETVLETADLTEAERATITIPMLRSMISTNTASTSALIGVTVSGPDASLNHRLAQAIEKVLPIYCDRFNNQEHIENENGEEGSFMLKITDRSTPGTHADNAKTLVSYPFLAFVLIFFALYVILVIKHLCDTTIYDRDDLKEKLPNAPLFGLIPSWNVSDSKTRQKKTKTSHSFAKERMILQKNTPVYVSEAFRQLSTNVTFCSTGEKGCTIGMVSARAATGKSFVISNLAVSLSQRIGKKVLLIDADMRCPMVHQVFELKNTVGLSQLLTGQVSDQTDLYQTVKGCSLTVLTSGELPPNPLELLSSPQMKVQLEKWKQEYDYVLLDLPPVGEVADALVLSRDISGYLFALRSGVSDIRDVLEAFTLLEERDAKIHGCVLTDVEKKFSSYYYMYGKTRNKLEKA